MRAGGCHAACCSWWLLEARRFRAREPGAAAHAPTQPLPIATPPSLNLGGCTYSGISLGCLRLADWPEALAAICTMKWLMEGTYLPA
jgi:hypothetical protein